MEPAARIGVIPELLGERCLWGESRYPSPRSSTCTASWGSRRIISKGWTMTQQVRGFKRPKCRLSAGGTAFLKPEKSARFQRRQPPIRHESEAVVYRKRH